MDNHPEAQASYSTAPDNLLWAQRGLVALQFEPPWHFKRVIVAGILTAMGPGDLSAGFSAPAWPCRPSVSISNSYLASESNSFLDHGRQDRLLIRAVSRMSVQPEPQNPLGSGGATATECADDNGGESRQTLLAIPRS